jgi:serine/threonine-protein kinase
MAQAQVKDAPASAVDARPDLPAWTDDVISRALAKAPAQRFQSAMEFHEAFARALTETPQPIPIVAPALERTEVMERPDFSQRPAAAPQAAVTKAPRRLGAGWLIVGAALVVTAGVWFFFARPRCFAERGE